jgi:hypothetical protein
MSEAGARDARVHPEVAAARVYVPPLTIVVTVHMWITWAELAVEHEQEALSARQAMLDLHAKGGNFAVELGRETGESLLAICSAAFAMDALVGVWARLVMDSQTVAKWESPGVSINMGNRTEQVLRRSCKDAKTAIDLSNRWRAVFGQRGGAVHFSETSGGPTVPHPAGIGNVAEVHLTYQQETAAAAVDLLIETLSEVESASKPQLTNWVGDMAHVVASLRTKRNKRQ